MEWVTCVDTTNIHLGLTGDGDCEPINEQYWGVDNSETEGEGWYQLMACSQEKGVDHSWMQ